MESFQLDLVNSSNVRNKIVSEGEREREKFCIVVSKCICFETTEKKRLINTYNVLTEYIMLLHLNVH